MNGMLWKHATRALLASALLAGTVVAQAATLQILSVNDTHSNLEASGPKDANLDGTIGGLPKAATVIAQLRAAEPNTLFLHAGDLFFGDAYFNATYGSSEMQLLASLGLDAMAVGNHEFWLPWQALAGGYMTAFPGGGGFPLLCANLESPSLPFIVPSVIRDVGGVRVGVFGLVTPYDAITNRNATIRGQDPAELLRIAGMQAAQLRAAGAQVVVLLSHLGIDLDRAIAANVPGLDAIVGGHDHYSIAETVNGVPIVHAGAYYREVGQVKLSVGSAGASVVSRELIEVDAGVPRLPPVAAAVAQVQDYVRWVFAPVLEEATYGLYYRTPIATATEDVTNAINFRSTRRDTGTGNLVTDSMRARTGTDIAVTVSGQTPQGIAAGPIVAEDLFRVVGDAFDPLGLPASPDAHFGWRLVTFSLTGAELSAALEATIHTSMRDDDYIAQVSGMKYTYDTSLPAPPRLLSVRIGDEPLDPGRTYTVTSNYLVAGALPMFGVTPHGATVLGDFELTALRDYVIALGSVAYEGESRVKDLAPGASRR
jgi:5'-nucleotidase/UDP-sugar diphosphatase